MDGIRQSNDSKTLYIASGYVGVIVVDISDITNPKHVTNVYYTFNENLITSAENVYLSKDNTALYAGYRYLGVVIYDITDPHNPLQKNILFTGGGEDMVLTSDNKYLIMCDGY